MLTGPTEPSPGPRLDKQASAAEMASVAGIPLRSRMKLAKAAEKTHKISYVKIAKEIGCEMFIVPTEIGKTARG